MREFVWSLGHPFDKGPVKLKNVHFKKKLVKWNEAISQNFFFFFSENKILISMDFFLRKQIMKLIQLIFTSFFFNSEFFQKYFGSLLYIFFYIKLHFPFFFSPLFFLSSSMGWRLKVRLVSSFSNSSKSSFTFVPSLAEVSMYLHFHICWKDW